MTVRIAADVAERIRRSPGRVILQVQQPSDPEAAAQALERARPDIDQLALRGTRAVERAPAGPFLLVVDRDDGRQRLLDVPALVASHLEAAGVDGALGCIDPGGFLTSALWGFPTLGPAVICRLYPPPPEIEEDPPTGLPEDWLGLTAAWLTDGLDGDHALWAEVGLVEFSVDAADVLRFLRQQGRSRRSATVVAARPRPVDAAAQRTGPGDAAWFCGDGSPRPIRAAALRSGPFQSHLALGAGGPGPADDLPSVFEAFAATARAVACGLAYGFVDVTPTFQRFAGATHPLEPFCDETVFDGFAFQVLGPGHLDRLGSLPPGARPLAGGRVELSSGAPSEWISEAVTRRAADLGGRRGALRQPVAGLLRPCLEVDGDELRQERWERVKRRRLHMDDLAVPEYRFDPPRR